jgi:glycosyltransferase involved in cell wall biosynthesis
MKGHILIVADGRSPTALSWIKNIQSMGYQVSLISSFYCEKPPQIKGFSILPIALSRFSANSQVVREQSSITKGKTLVRRFAPFLQKIRYILGPLSLLRYASPYKKLVEEIAPDLVHALRIPYEGMLGSSTPREIPFVAAIWGNDLTLHAKGSWLMRRFTRRCLSRADGLTSDTERDIRLAFNCGLSSTAPTLTIPGSGGLNWDAIENSGEFDNPFNIPEGVAWVVNPRGLRPGSVHQEVFFEAVSRVIKAQPNVRFICPNLAGQSQAEVWVKQFNIEAQTFLLPKLTQSQLWALFKKSALFVSPSSHDGTPNTLLEAMACGCLPIVGDIESMRAWIDHGKNGFLIDPLDSHALAQAMIAALKDPALRQSAAEINLEKIKQQAAQDVTLPLIDAFYAQFLK